MARKSPYLEHFGLKKSPFSTTPDPDFAFATKQHREALINIAYYTDEKRGMYLLMGNVGTGKTTLSQLLLNGWRAQPEGYIGAHITDPSPRTAAAFLRLIMASFGLPSARNLLDLKATLRGFLVEQYKAGRTVVLLIDEAQSITSTNLDTLQAISNEQTQKDKLIQIILLAQPTFQFKLTQKPALQSRIAGGMTLNPVNIEDAIDLLRHRMDVAGGDFDEIFPVSTHKAIYNATNGIPRDLCVLCDAAMIKAFAQDRKTVENDLLEAVMSDLSFKEWGKKNK